MAACNHPHGPVIRVTKPRRINVGSSTLPGYGRLLERDCRGARHSYSGVDSATGEEVELEVVESGGGDTASRRRAAVRARLLVELSEHPNIARIYREFATPGGDMVLALEHCSASLATVVRAGGPVTPPTALSVARRVAGALEVLHGVGLTHLAMCPENLMVSSSGEVVLAGFANTVLGESHLESVEVSAALEVHSAPETLEGALPAPAADVYSLASVLYWLLSGRPPFEPLPGDSPASLPLRVLSEPAPILCLQVVPIELSDLIASALSKNPLERPSSAKLFSEALGEIQAGNGWAPEPLNRTVESRAVESRAVESSAQPENGESVKSLGLAGAVEPGDAVGDRPPDGTAEERRLGRSRLSLEEPRSGVRSVEVLSGGRRGQPTLPLKVPEEHLEPLKSATQSPQRRFGEQVQPGHSVIGVPRAPMVPTTRGAPPLGAMDVGGSAGDEGSASDGRSQGGDRTGLAARWGRVMAFPGIGLPARRNARGGRGSAGLPGAAGSGAIRSGKRRRGVGRSGKGRLGDRKRSNPEMVISPAESIHDGLVGDRPRLSGGTEYPMRLPVPAKMALVVAAVVIVVAAVLVFGLL